MAFALPVLSMERFDKVSPTFSDSSLSEIFRFAIITSRFTILIAKGRMLVEKCGLVETCPKFQR